MPELPWTPPLSAGAGDALRVVVLRVAVGGRVVHVAERVARGARRVDVLADLPGVRVRRAAVLRVRLAGVAEDVGGRFVERARLIRVGQVRGALGDGVRQLVRVDVEGAARAAMNCVPSPSP